MRFAGFCLIEVVLEILSFRVCGVNMKMDKKTRRTKGCERSIEIYDVDGRVHA